jgi:FAD/FMN-containing dehydrogenase
MEFFDIVLVADFHCDLLPCLPPSLSSAYGGFLTGDGNFHVLIFFRPEMAEEVAQAKSLASHMALRAIALGGTCTGEHGVGVGKKDYLRVEMGDSMIDLMKLLKTTMDPVNILNPGKIIDTPPAVTSKCCKGKDTSCKC